MSEQKKQKLKPKGTAKVPKAIVPPRLGPLIGRPMASKPSQRGRKRKPAAKPAGTLTANASGGEGEIMLYGTIGADFWGEGVTASGFNDALAQLGNVSKIVLRINSGGGDVFEATAIYNMLVKSVAEVVVEIEGVAASAATLIAMAGDKIHISENAHFMIHRASGLAYGNADELRQYLKLLDNADGLIRLTYSRRTGLEDTKLAKLMDHDNWMTAQEAADLGFVDVIDGAKTVEPHVTPAKASAKQPVTLDNNRLAAMAESLSVLQIAASASHTGDSPQTVPLSTKETKKMNAKLRAKCIAAGMDETLTGDSADQWLDANFDTVFAGKPEQPKPEPNDDALTAAFKKFNAIEAAERKAFRKEVDANLSLAFGDNAPASLKIECYDLQIEGIEAVRAKILDAKKAGDTDTGGLRIRFSDSQPRDRHLAAIKAGVQVRALGGGAEKHLPSKDRPKDYEAFSQMPLIKVAEQCLLADGFTYDQVNRLPAPQLAMAAMGFHRNAGLRANAGLHTTGSLLEVTRDAMNKTLLAGYNEAPQTWRGPIRQAASVSDFKQIHRVKLSSVGNLSAWVDGLAPELAKLSNERESYAVEASAATLSFSWRLYVNDDLDAISRGPQMLGNAAGRTVNTVAWNAVLANPTMADGKAFFLETPAGNRFRKNLTTGAATPTNISIAAMRTLMRLMRGLNTPENAESADILNLTPRYICLPTALEGVVTQQVNSSADPAASGNAGIVNLVKFWGLEPVIEPLLDANSAKAWYLVADPSTIDGVELSFLQGQETPMTHEWMDDATMSQNFTIVQTCAARAIDFRAWQKHAGE